MLWHALWWLDSSVLKVHAATTQKTMTSNIHQGCSSYEKALSILLCLLINIADIYVQFFTKLLCISSLNWPIHNSLLLNYFICCPFVIGMLTLLYCCSLFEFVMFLSAEKAVGDFITRNFITFVLHQLLLGWSNQGGWDGQDM